MSGFEVSRSDFDNVTALHLSGFLDAHTVPVFEESIQNLLKENVFNIIVNMQNLDYISSAGLGVFMGFIEEIREHGGDIKLSNLSAKVYKVFDLLGFPALFEIFDDENDAKSQFKKFK